MNLSHLVHLYKESSHGIPPIIIDQSWCELFLQSIWNEDHESLEAWTESKPNEISLYKIAEDKKLFDIETVKWLLRDISLIPYGKKHIYLLENIDHWTPKAMNALLKILEDCPEYACIILIVDDPYALISTIHSRCMNFFSLWNLVGLKEDTKKMLDEYWQWNPSSFIGYLHTWKIEKDEAINLLRYSLSYAKHETLKAIENALIQLHMWHDAPRNTLDTVFLVNKD